MRSGLLNTEAVATVMGRSPWSSTSLKNTLELVMSLGTSDMKLREW